MKYPSAPGATYNGKFDNGVPGVRAASTDDANYMNAVYDEIINVITAGGLVPDENDLTQLMKAIQSSALTGGRLLNVQVFSASGTYTPTPGTRSVIVEMVGGGGGSGGVPATGAGQGALSGTGASGSYAKGRFTTGFSGVAVTVGAGGAAGVANGNGGNGGTSSFGALMSAPGGGGSPVGLISSGSPINPSGGVVAGAPSGANLVSSSGIPPAQSMLATPTIASQASISSTPFGKVGSGSYGAYVSASSAAAPGSAGNAGLVIVWEYA